MPAVTGSVTPAAETSGAMQRTRRLRFIRPPDHVTEREVIRDLLAVDGVEAADFQGAEIRIHYRFPEVALDSLLGVFEGYQDRLRLRPLQRVRLRILAYMEENERVAAASACGWRRYLEDIYSRYFNTGMPEQGDVRKQTWRKYK